MTDYITIDEARIRFELIDGHPERPVLVFLHQGLGCVEMWKDFPATLCSITNCPGLVYDRQGFGKSSSLRRTYDIDYVHAYARRELAVLQAELIGDRPYLLIGHSDGASIALIFGAAERPGLKGIISEAAHVFVEDITISGIREAKRNYRQDGPKGLTKYHGSRTDAVFKGWSETWLSDWFREWNIEALLPAITCPVLALQGVDDEYGTQLQVESIVSRVSGPAEPVMISDCGHTVHRSCSDKMVELIDRFINRFI